MDNQSKSKSKSLSHSIQNDLKKIIQQISGIQSELKILESDSKLKPAKKLFGELAGYSDNMLRAIFNYCLDPLPARKLEKAKAVALKKSQSKKTNIQKTKSIDSGPNLADAAARKYKK